MAYAFAVVLIERVPSEAARASRPTASTPGSPWRKRRSALSDAVTSAYAGECSGGHGHQMSISTRVATCTGGQRQRATLDAGLRGGRDRCGRWWHGPLPAKPHGRQASRQNRRHDEPPAARRAHLRRPGLPVARRHGGRRAAARARRLARRRRASSGARGGRRGWRSPRCCWRCRWWSPSRCGPRSSPATTGCAIRNPFRTITLPWAAVADVRAGYSSEVFTQDGTKYQLWADPGLAAAAQAGLAPADAAGARRPARADVRARRTSPTRRRGWRPTDQTVADLRELAERNAARPGAQGEPQVRWAYEVVAPAVAGAVLLVVLLAIG